MIASVLIYATHSACFNILRPPLLQKSIRPIYNGGVVNKKGFETFFIQTFNAASPKINGVLKKHLPLLTKKNKSSS